jgi:hypothetical protein
MKTLISLAVLLAVVGVAQADSYHETDYHDGIKRPAATHQNLSRKPYAAPVVKTETFDGAVVDKEVVEQPKRLNLHMLDRRPYMEKAAD